MTPATAVAILLAGFVVWLFSATVVPAALVVIALTVLAIIVQSPRPR